LNPEEAKERIQDRLDLYPSKKVGKFLLLSKQTGEVIAHVSVMDDRWKS
jgi:hypothetical protein